MTFELEFFHVFPGSFRKVTLFHYIFIDVFKVLDRIRQKIDTICCKVEITKAPAAETGMLIRKPVADVFEAFIDPEVTTNKTHVGGRWVIAGSVLFGWVLAVFVSLPQIIIGFVFAFLAGGVILKVLKEELPEERRSKFRPFALGGIFYASLLILV